MGRITLRSGSDLERSNPVKTRYRFDYKAVLVAFVITFIANTASAVVVGPSHNPVVETPRTEKKLPDPLDLIPLDAVVVVLDPGFVMTDTKLTEKGIWPELRNTESIRSAIKIKESLIGINQFDSVLVVPSKSVSADFYLMGMIKESTGEILKINYLLVDATGKTHLNKTATHRVELGWHSRFGGQGIDPFQDLYDEIGIEVWKTLKKMAENHTKTTKNNKSRANRGKSIQLSDVETIAAVRDIVSAQYFNPELYSDAVEIQNKNNAKASYYTVSYLPDANSEDWKTIKRVEKRDREFLETMNQHYDHFHGEIEESYAEWQEDILPIAREVRLAKRSQTISLVSTAVLAAATIASAADADKNENREKALAIGGVLTGAALLKHMFDRNDKNGHLDKFSELSKAYHDDFKPIRVNVANEIVTLEGTAIEQYNQWRAMLTDLYQLEYTDFDSIAIIE